MRKKDDSDVLFFGATSQMLKAWENEYQSW